MQCYVEVEAIQIQLKRYSNQAPAKGSWRFLNLITGIQQLEGIVFGKNYLRENVSMND